MTHTLRLPTKNEEIANTYTAAIGLVFAVAGFPTILRNLSVRGDSFETSSSIIYGVTLVLLYLASTLYHGATRSELKHFFRICDHVCIYLLIAGTYTPYTLITLRGGSGMVLFSLVWALALAGCALSIISFRKFKRLSTATYLLLGWLGIAVSNELLHSMATEGVLLLFGGAAFYTTGVLFYAWHKLPYHHAIWHLWVLGGSICHYFSIVHYIFPQSS